ncbi:hypothetical protein PLUTE_a3199 [Pseudoalteromonas luteoviolacea DSM 6061]|nr:hypothetical protein [Pseudoalteromonas luteoviolacea DSM 6061]
MFVYTFFVINRQQKANLEVCFFNGVYKVSSTTYFIALILRI